ncbi:MAG TPA: DNA-directed RNA polymerase [Candidatus Nanoarchaeia archaeon]|nr:DNA-directed RNA polymerase [Candidatus Nanoarchaeia archaeon]
MFYKIEVNDHIRVPPKVFQLETKDAVIQRIKKKYEGYISKELGIVIDVADVKNIEEGIIITGDGAAYFNTTFELYAFKPEMQEVVHGNVRDIADFGVFMNLGPIEGMIHISQTMDDFVSFSKDKVLTGKESKRNLRVGDRCKARIIAVSFKDVMNPKLGLTMRQPFLGRIDWSEENKEGKSESKSESKKGKEKEAKK